MRKQEYLDLVPVVSVLRFKHSLSLSFSKWIIHFLVKHMEGHWVG